MRVPSENLPAHRTHVASLSHRRTRLADRRGSPARRRAQSRALRFDLCDGTRSGFSSDDAYWIAAYDEATDLGSFSPQGDRRQAGTNSAALTTSDIGGLVRTNFNTGGLLFHFVATFKDQPNQTPDGLHPNPRDAQHEILLTHLRRWAMAGPGSNAPLCTVDSLRRRPAETSRPVTPASAVPTRCQSAA